MDMFDISANEATAESRPLAERMRPRCLADFIGQADVVGPGTLLSPQHYSVCIYQSALCG